MKTITQSNPVQLSTSISGYRKLNHHLIHPVIAGFLGFSVILMIIYFIIGCFKIIRCFTSYCSQFLKFLIILGNR